jgi:single-stranded DNA-binding protein
MTSESHQNHLCNVTLLGNLVGKPDIRYQANPIVAVAEFTLATHSRWFDKSTKKFKEWTSFHTVKVIGDIVDRSLLHANKGDIILIQGYLLNSKKNGREIIHATYAQTYPKGYALSLNQIHCSGRVISEIKLVKTENDKELAEFYIESNYSVHSTITEQIHIIAIKRPVHIWGKQAHNLYENVNCNDQIIVDGKLSYLNNKQKSQFIDAQQVILLNRHK